MADHNGCPCKIIHGFRPSGGNNQSILSVVVTPIVKKFPGLVAAYILLSGGGMVHAQHTSIVKFVRLREMMARQTDTTYVFNFFATWCVPCVEELPSFQEFAEQMAGRKVKIIFVSLDFRKDYRKRLIPFVKKHHMEQQVILLDEPDYNSWIDSVDGSWDGNLPATLVVNNRKHIRTMFAEAFTPSSLEAKLDPLLR